MTSNGPAFRTVSFYRYVKLENPEELKSKLFDEWRTLGVLGRTYLSREGINAQVTVPVDNIETFESLVSNVFPDIPFKYALEDRQKAFKKLKIKVRSKIVADGLKDESFDSSNVGQHLNAKQFNEAIQDPNTLVVDMRNHYECEVGRFDKAYLPKANTFREALPEVKQHLEGKEDKKILLYCTGGIRCEKASAWLKHQGFTDVNQLHGGIIDYYRQIQDEKIPSLFRGVNFVFDDRLGERVTEDVLSHCHQCGERCDTHTNCPLPSCNLLFIQCENCRKEFEACCSFQCRDILYLPRDEQVRIQNIEVEQIDKFMRSRRRPDLMQLKEDYLREHPERARPLKDEPFDTSARSQV